METTSLGLDGLFVIEPERSGDDHGRYSYFYSERGFREAGAASHYVQEHASSYRLRHTVRGLHFQKPPHAQHKVVRVARGRIWDVCVDVRLGSPTYGQHAAIELEAGDWRQLHGMSHFKRISKDVSHDHPPYHLAGTRCRRTVACRRPRAVAGRQVRPHRPRRRRVVDGLQRAAGRGQLRDVLGRPVIVMSKLGAGGRVALDSSSGRRLTAAR